MHSNYSEKVSPSLDHTQQPFSPVRAFPEHLRSLVEAPAVVQVERDGGLLGETEVTTSAPRSVGRGPGHY